MCALTVREMIVMLSTDGQGVQRFRRRQNGPFMLRRVECYKNRAFTGFGRSTFECAPVLEVRDRQFVKYVTATHEKQNAVSI